MSAIHILNKVLGPENTFTLKDRILNAALFSSIVVSLLALLADSFQGLGGKAYLYDSFMALTNGTIYYFGRQKSNTRRLVYLYLLVSLTPILFVWFYFGGLSGATLLFFIAIVVIAAIITKGLIRFAIITALIGIISLLFFIETNNPETVNYFADQSSLITDKFISAIYLAIMLSLLMLLIMHSYRKEQLKVESLNHTKDKFLSIIAHDLKSPLSALSQLGQVLAENHNKIPPAKRKKLIDSITKTSTNTYNLVENLLQWARSESGMLVIKPEKLDINDLIHFNLKILEDNIQNKSISIHSQIETNLYAWADYHMIHTVFRNLLSNAVKFTPEHGEITVQASKNAQNSKINISISDTGIGIAQENIAKLFDIDNDFTRKGTNDESGTGLGLKLCKEFISKNLGTICVESEVLKGSTFSVTLPAQS
ncbi:MAG TPA: hypothetical protein DDX98_10320 [Bacteroidales bacterium]|nr:hypothetical protein [Bacteroidales bacterium]